MSYEMLGFFSMLCITLSTGVWRLSQAMLKNTMMICNKIDALDGKLTGKIEAQDGKLTGKIDALDLKLTDRIDALGVDVHKLDKRLHGIEVLYQRKPLHDPLGDDNIEFEEG